MRWTQPMKQLNIATLVFLFLVNTHLSMSIELYPCGIRNRKHKQEVAARSGWAPQETIEQYQRRVHTYWNDFRFHPKNPDFPMDYTLFKQVEYYIFDPDFGYHSPPDFYDCDIYGFRFHPSFPTGGSCSVYYDPITPLEVVLEADRGAKALDENGNVKPNWIIIEYSRGDYVRRLISPEGKRIPLILLPSGKISGPPCAYDEKGMLKPGWELKEECWHVQGCP